MLSCSVTSNSLQPLGLQPFRPLCPWGFSRQEHWSEFLCPSPGDLSNPGLPHCRQILYWLSHQGSPMLLINSDYSSSFKIVLHHISGRNINYMAYDSKCGMWISIHYTYQCAGFLGGSDCKASACNAEDQGSIPGLVRSPGERNGNPLQYSRLENPMDGEDWWATVHGVSKSQTQLSNFTFLPMCWYIKSQQYFIILIKYKNVLKALCIKHKQLQTNYLWLLLNRTLMCHSSELNRPSKISCDSNVEMGG